MTNTRSVAPAQALVWFTLALPVFVSIAGLVIDGGVLLTSRRELQSVADGAARAGATRVDTALLRSSGGTDIQLDPTLAMDATRTYLEDALVGNTLAWQTPPAAQIEIGARRVSVLVRGSTRTAFLRIVHIDVVAVEAAAFADVQFGIRDADGN
jgi:Flp pilus assembly protein TadG